VSSGTGPCRLSKEEGPGASQSAGEMYAGEKALLAQEGGRKQGKVQQGNERLTRPQQA